MRHQLKPGNVFFSLEAFGNNSIRLIEAVLHSGLFRRRNARNDGVVLKLPGNPPFAPLVGVINAHDSEQPSIGSDAELGKHKGHRMLYVLLLLFFVLGPFPIGMLVLRKA